MSYTRYLQTYKENQIQTTDPGTVLLLLYQGAINFLRRAMDALEVGDVAEKGKWLLKVRAIISEFHASLDMEVGGELAKNLEALYVFMLDQITSANLNNDPKPLEGVISLLTTLKEGWEKAVVEERKRVVQETT